MSTEPSGLDLARQALVAAREAAKRNGGTQTKKAKRHTGTVVRRDGREPLQRARAAAAAVWARVRPVVDIVLAAVDVVAVVYVMRGAFKRHHLLAEARRYLSYVLRGRPHPAGLTRPHD